MPTRPCPEAALAVDCWSPYRLARICGIMIPHRCLPNADNISGRFARGQRLEVARERRHKSGRDVGLHHLRARRRCAPASCPNCGRRVRKLKLHEKVMCWRCCVQSGLGYRISDGSAAERAEARARQSERLQAQLGGGPLRLHPRPGRVMDRRGALELRLRRARIVGRLSVLRGIKDSAEG
jgi:hypothetical protein